MNGKNTGRPGERWIIVVQGLQQDGNQGGLPIVTMKEVGRSHNLCRLQHGPAKQRKALGIIVIVA